MKKEIRFDAASSIGLVTKIVDGVLTGQVKFDIRVSPADIGRLLNFQTRHTTLNVIIEAPQAEFDLEFTEVADPDLAAHGFKPVEFKEITFKIAEGEATPYHFTIDGLEGAGESAQEAVLTALKSLGIDHPGMFAKPAEMADVLQESYPTDRFPKMEYIADVLRYNTFDVTTIQEARAKAAADQGNGATGKKTRKSRKPKNKAPA